MTSDSLRLPRFPLPFARRAARFRHLADERPALAGYLFLLADVAEAQARRAPAGGMGPPASFAGGPPPVSAWASDLRALAAAPGPRPEPLGGLLARLPDLSEQELRGFADALRAGDAERLDPGLAPFVAAALQIRWTAWAAGLDGAAVPEPADPARCPVCGGPPVAAVLQTHDAVAGLRFLCCALCGSQWNRVRSQCVLCGSAGNLAYFVVEGAGGAVRAEACGGCGSYLKLLDREKDPGLDPVADDIASLALDVKMAEEGYGRLGFNPFLVAGA